MPRTRKLLKRLENIRRRRPEHYDGFARQTHKALPERTAPTLRTTHPPTIRAIRLDGQAHPPHELVDTAIKSFADRNRLSAKQLSAKRHMIRYLLRSMTRRRAHLIPNLHTFARWADTFFFQSTLTGTTWCNACPPLEGLFAATQEQVDRDHFFVLEGIAQRHHSIHVNVQRLAEQADWEFEKGATIAALLRVLTRMYLTIYGCVCDENGCFQKIPSTYGITGQGYCWQVLMSTIILEIRSWDHRLRNFANHRAGRHGFDRAAADREQLHWHVLRQTRQWEQLVRPLDYPAVGEYGLEFRPELRVVKRRGRNLRREAEGLRREQERLRREAGGLQDGLELPPRGRRERRRPQRYGFDD